MVTVWTGREANALREAMRLSIDDFAVLAQISRRSVANWSSKGGATRLRWDAQRSLDRVLASAGQEVRTRFDSLLNRPAGEAGPSAPDLVTSLINPAEPEPDQPVPPLILLEREVGRMRMGYQAGRFRETAERLPKLMRTLANAKVSRENIGGTRKAARASTGAARVGKLAAEAYHVATELLLRSGDVALSMYAAQRCAEEARSSCQPLTLAASQRATASVLTRSGHADTAVELSARAAQRLRDATGLDGPRPLSGYGALLLTGALAHARLGDRKQATARLDEAAQVAERLGGDGNYGWTAFGPTNVALHRLSALTALDDPATGLRAVAHLEPKQIRPVERRAAYYLETAAALHSLGKAQAAATATARAGELTS